MPTWSGDLTDRSGTLAQTDVSQQAAAANTGRKYLLIHNPGRTSGGAESTEEFFVNIGAAATRGAGSLRLEVGSVLEWPRDGFVPNGAVAIIGTAGCVWTVKEG